MDNKLTNVNVYIKQRRRQYIQKDGVDVVDSDDFVLNDKKALTSRCV